MVMDVIHCARLRQVGLVDLEISLSEIFALKLAYHIIMITDILLAKITTLHLRMGK
jgi:hypothetical protein